ncbi:L-ascorbate oxidase [Tanacetum coccineum]|uniref:L-ascorbate oxidase n=1 Tax=Tanacetum coccineum TaxID=301880 RepID=A0ABQ5GBP0_9ASTR
MEHEKLTLLMLLAMLYSINGEDPYRFFDWNVTYGDIYPLGVKQQVWDIDKWAVSRATIDSVTNVNVIEWDTTEEKFMARWSLRHELPNPTWPKLYIHSSSQGSKMVSFFFFPYTWELHRAAEVMVPFTYLQPPEDPVPSLTPRRRFSLFSLDLKAILDGGHDLPFPDGLLINGRGSNGFTFNVDQGKTYRLRISNVGLIHQSTSGSRAIRDVDSRTEGTHTLQNTYSSLDIHLGQSYSVLITADQPPANYYMVVSTRFTSQVLTATSILRYSNSGGSFPAPPPGGPTIQIDWSI